MGPGGLSSFNAFNDLSCPTSAYPFIEFQGLFSGLSHRLEQLCWTSEIAALNVSAVPPKAAAALTNRRARFGPISDIALELKETAN